MDTLSLMNCRTIIVKLKDLEHRKPYTIIQAEKVKSTKYNTTQLKLKIELDVDIIGIVYLPSRFAKKLETDEQVQDIVHFKLVYNGMTQYDGYTSHDIKFIE